MIRAAVNETVSGDDVLDRFHRSCADGKAGRLGFNMDHLAGERISRRPRFTGCFLYPAKLNAKFRYRKLTGTTRGEVAGSKFFSRCEDRLNVLF